MVYEDLVKRYGVDGAYDMLVIIEKLARIYNNVDPLMSMEERLAHAMSKLDEIDFAAQQGSTNVA